ncbi:chaplin [Streptomyces longwoodensis]|uniref:chaplin n=1 Tax=Streptomyces longwoodensis TaxID=68231 RepID=UPI002DDC2E8F|nr:chaplin [Streptomyces longwoodensis]WRY88683.1 chaplin [Streptomyces longwoodensis]
MSRIAKAAAVALGTGAVVLSGTGLAMADAGANGAAIGSPGVLSGNVVQVPVHVPVNVCGNTVNIVGLLNPAAGNTCANISSDEHGGGSDKDSHDRHGDSKHDDSKSYGD